jgi:hypothetical protein
MAAAAPVPATPVAPAVSAALVPLKFDYDRLVVSVDAVKAVGAAAVH